MRVQKKTVIAIILLLISIIIHFYSYSKTQVESGYNTHFFAPFSRMMRTVFGSIPFSVGDILYSLLVLWLIWRLARFARLVFRKQPGFSKKPLYINSFLNLFIFCCSIYIVFNVFWGINYNRKGIAWQLNLKMEKYDTQDVKNINAMLVTHINNFKKVLVDNKVNYPSDKQLFASVDDAYKQVATRYPFLKYDPPSIKSSMWGWLGNYTGFTGYYNPFTGEAQLNNTVPKFLHPFISCHEVAHQLGYAKEMEANFVGYLAASSSSDPLFRYSVYLDLFLYANRNLYLTDTVASKMYRKALNPAVLADLKEWAAFNRNHHSFAEPIVRWIYGKYLQGNQQPQGVLSYDEVTAFIIAYYKKFGRI